MNENIILKMGSVLIVKLAFLFCIWVIFRVIDLTSKVKGWVSRPLKKKLKTETTSLQFS